MRTVESRWFQGNYQRCAEPVKVMARSRTLGVWYPKGTLPETPEPAGDNPWDHGDAGAGPRGNR